MVYECMQCDYFSNSLYNYNRHLKTQKHKNQILEKEKSNSNKKKEQNILIIKAQKSTKKAQKSEKGVNKDLWSNKFICEYCNKELSTNNILQRHQKIYCKVIKKYNKEYDNEYDKEMKIKELEKKVEKLLIFDKNKNYEDFQKFGKCKYPKSVNKDNYFSNNVNSNNQTNNIQINLFKNEDLTCLTDNFLDKVINYSFGIGELMTKKIYFNDKFPQNKTIKMVNRKDELIKVKTIDGFKFIDKNEVYDHIIDNNDFILEEHFNGNKEKYSEYKKNRYEKLRNLMDDNDSELLKKIKNDIKMVLWNNMDEK